MNNNKSVWYKFGENIEPEKYELILLTNGYDTYHLGYLDRRGSLMITTMSGDVISDTPEGWYWFPIPKFKLS